MFELTTSFEELWKKHCISTHRKTINDLINISETKFMFVRTVAGVHEYSQNLAGIT